MIKKGFALLSALAAACLLSVGALAAEPNEVEVTVADEDALRAAVTSVEGNDALDTVVFATGLENASISLRAPLVISKDVTITLSGQTITASYDTDQNTPTLTVFQVKEGASLTLQGEGTIRAAALEANSTQTATPYAIVLAQGDPHGGSLTVKDNVSVKAEGDSATLIALGTKSSLTLTTEKDLEGGSTAVRALSGATGYSVTIDMKGKISSTVALLLNDNPTVSLKNAILNGSLSWEGGEAQTPAPALSALTAAGSWVFVNETAVTDEVFAAAPVGDTKYSFRTYYTVTYADGNNPEDVLSTFKVAQGASTPSFGDDPDKANFVFTGWNPALPATVWQDWTFQAQWAAAHALTISTSNLTFTGAAKAKVGEDYVATLTPDEGYRLPLSPQVYYTDGGVVIEEATLVNGTLTIPAAKITAPITIGTSAIPQYTVTLTPGDHYTLTPTVGSQSPVDPNGSFSFTLAYDAEYYGGTVMVNDQELTPEGGVYTISQIQENKTVTVSNIQLTNYSILRPAELGFECVISQNSVPAGGSASVVITIYSGFARGANFAVLANGVPMTEDPANTFTAYDIHADQSITVEGVVRRPTISSNTPPTRTGAREALFKFTCSEAGTCYYMVTDPDAAAPDAATIKQQGTSRSCNAYELLTVSLDNLGTPGAWKVYVLGENADGIQSQVYTINLPAAATYEVTLSSGTGSTIEPLDDNPVVIGESFRFKLTIQEGYYKRDDFFVSVSGTRIYPDDSGIYTITDIRSRKSVYVYGVSPYTYEVILPTGIGFTAAASPGSASPVSYGSSFSFTVNIATGYQKGAGFSVTANGAALTADASGIYTIPDIHSAQTVAVSGVEVATYTVTLRNGTGYTVNAVSGSVSPVNHGGSFQFTVDVQSGYQKGSNFAVKANSITLTPSNGVYTISNITANQTVTVTGVTVIQSNTNRGSSYGGGSTTASAPSITTTLLASATLGQAYSQQLTATGTAPITWTYTGALPDGITLGSANGLLSGTPTSAGTFRFAVKASNSRGTATRQMTLVVTSVEYTVTAGNNAQWTQGSKDGLTFTGSGKESFTVQIDNATVDNKYLTFSTDGASVTVSADYLSTLATGSHNLSLVYKNGSAKGKFTIRVNPQNAKPTITAQPLSGEVKEGDSVTLSVTATGSAPMSYVWQVDKGDGKGWTDVPGATASSLSLKKVTADQNGYKYRCVVKNDAGTAESSAATLTVRTALGTVTTTTSSPSPSPTAEPAASNRSPVITILGIALGLVVVGLGGVLGVRYYRKKKYNE